MHTMFFTLLIHFKLMYKNPFIQVVAPLNADDFSKRTPGLKGVTINSKFIFLKDTLP